MSARSVLLGAALLGAAALWIYSRTKGGQAVVAGVTGGIGEDLSAVGEALGVIPRGIRNHNPGNLRFIADPGRAWNGQVADDGGYGVYSSPALGVRAMSHQLQADYARGDQTLAALISTWAPPAENDTTAYIADVADQLGVDPSAPFDLQGSLPQLAAAITQHENGQQPYDLTDLTQWVYS